MTTMVTATARDAWADATQVATQEVLDPDVAAARRRAWLRRALPLAVGAVVVLAVYVAYDSAVGLEAANATVADVPPALRWSAYALVGVGFVLLLLANMRSAAAGTMVTFVGPADLLPRSGRAWVRRQIGDGAAVADDRTAVVTATARRMSDEGRNVLQPVAKVCFLVGIGTAGMFLSQLVFFGALVAWTVVDMVRTERWARRARHWLGENAGGEAAT